MDGDVPCNLMRIVRVPASRLDELRYFKHDSVTPRLLSPTKLPPALENIDPIETKPMSKSYRLALNVSEARTRRYLDYIKSSAQAVKLNRDHITVGLIDRLTDTILHSVIKSATGDVTTLIDHYVKDLVDSEFNT